MCHFGIARCDITPPVGIYHRMWGAATHDQATGIHRPLCATALIFQCSPEASQEKRQVFVTLDHCLLWSSEMEQLLATIERQTGIPSANIVVTFSHTHAAGLMGMERTELPGGSHIPNYLNWMANEISDIVIKATECIQPVTITYGTGHCQLAAHRDFWDETNQQYVCGFNPEGPTDSTVVVARVTAEDDKPVAILVNYACHPTTLAWANTLISPDFPGATREVIEQVTGTLSVFLQGTSGDLGPQEGYVGDPNVADKNGRQLGYAALATLESMPPPGTNYHYSHPVISGATLGAWTHQPLAESERIDKSIWHQKLWTIELPYHENLPTQESVLMEQEKWSSWEREAQESGNEKREKECRAMVERTTRQLTRLRPLPSGTTFPLPVWMLRLGDAFWIFVHGEPYHIFQENLRKRFPDQVLVISSLANGSILGYLPTRETYGKGIYQELISIVSEGSLEQVIDAVAGAIDACIHETR